MITQQKIRTPKSKRGAETLIEKIGEWQRQATTIETAMNRKVSAVEANFKSQAAVYNQQIESGFAAVYEYAQANRDKLLVGDEKTAHLATGELAWRLSPMSVDVQGKEADIIAALKEAKLKAAIRVKESLDKTVLKKDPGKYNGIEGLGFVRNETFTVKPAGSEIERAKVVRSVPA